MDKSSETEKKTEFKNAYLIYGSEEFLCRDFLNELLGKLHVSDDDMNFKKLEGKNISEEEIIDICGTMPFLSDRRVVLIEDSGFFKEKKEKLAVYADSLPKYLTLIFYERDVDKRNKLYKSISRYGGCMRFDTLNEKQLEEWILKYLDRNRKRIRRNTLYKFISGSGKDMNFISRELEKLISYTYEREEITQDDVEKICSTQAENRVFDMISFLAEGKVDQALKKYRDLIILKEAPLKIFYLVQRQFDRILRIKDLNSDNITEQRIAEILKLHPYAVKINSRLSREYTHECLENILRKLSEAEEKIKTGFANDTAELEIMIIGIFDAMNKT